ncbi:unnamed protein product [Zymoseptoria tritici ST99CH_3D7]|uniref:Uncharacterized protein n=1 Tax=Zymoseptoria tritici (strain ST99CH_3D7) TaxID=1276538 RepID=A0A1X7RDC0_ZYMT9|nr:unnamed protein product [Zymoseptoria tritici ST99CH_3D7]
MDPQEEREARIMLQDLETSPDPPVLSIPFHNGIKWTYGLIKGKVTRLEIVVNITTDTTTRRVRQYEINNAKNYIYGLQSKNISIQVSRQAVG